MTEHIELFQRALCFTPLYGLLDLLLIIHFCISWYRSAKRTGWKIDLWYLSLFMTVFQSICVLYFFNASVYNIPYVLQDYDKIFPFIDMAFMISAIGYLSLWAGRYLFDYSQGTFPLIAIFRIAEPFCRVVENNIKSQKAYLVLALATLFMGFLILAIQLKEGYFFNARQYFLQQPFLRPIFNMTISIIPIAFAFLALRLIQYKDKRCLKFFLMLTMITIFFGIRSLVLGGLLCLFINWIFYREGRFSVVKLALIFVFLFACAVILGNLREGDSLVNSFGYFIISFFYGNNFSDTRDFAWILSYWDGEHLYGKTYLAAFLSFIPRVFSSLREEWSISMYTNAITGFDPEVMPGLRPGMFGESFLNFGYLGVVLFGTVFGFSLRYADFKIKTYVEQSKDIIKGYSHMLVFSLISCLSVSASLWSFYIFVLINLALIVVRGRVPSTSLSQNPTEV